MRVAGNTFYTIKLRKNPKTNVCEGRQVRLSRLCSSTGSISAPDPGGSARVDYGPPNQIPPPIIILVGDPKRTREVLCGRCLAQHHLVEESWGEKGFLCCSHSTRKKIDKQCTSCARCVFVNEKILTIFDTNPGLKAALTVVSTLHGLLS